MALTNCITNSNLFVISPHVLLSKPNSPMILEVDGVYII